MATQPDNPEERADPAQPAVAPIVGQTLERTQVSKYHTRGGHGFAAEDANTLSDSLRGQRAEVVGTTNELNGADRLVNGVAVQSKYYATATQTVAAAFDGSTGTYRYHGQVLEVPRDQYDACVELMRERIRNGQVPGVSNPADAQDLVHQGTVTYRQARNIARAGNLDSLVYDAKTQAVTSTYVFAVSFAVTYACNRWRGEQNQVAIRSAIGSGLAAGGTTLITGIVGAQVLRTQAAAIGAVTVRSGVRAVSSTTLGREVVRRVATGSLGRAVYGAAATNHVSKLLRTNAITAVIVTAVTSLPDLYRVTVSRTISGRQFIKNVSVNGVTVVAGCIGWLGGMTVGAVLGSVVPVIGTAIVAMIGGFAGAMGFGYAAGRVAKALADRVIDDDAKPLIEALEDEISELSYDYMLSEAELEQVAAAIRQTVTVKWLRRMYAATRGDVDGVQRRAHVRSEFEPKIANIARMRPPIILPETDDLMVAIQDVTATVSNDTHAMPATV